MRRNKVLFITAWYPSKEHPISGIFVREHAKAVSRYDDVLVLHCHASDESLGAAWLFERENDESLTQGIPTFRLYYRSDLRRLYSWYVLLLLGVFDAFRRILALGFRPDIIHAHVSDVALPAALIARAWRMPVFVSEHSTQFVEKSLGGRLNMAVIRIAFGMADVVMPVGRALETSIKDYGIRARFRIIPNVIDSELFFPDNSLSQTDSRRLLFVGRLVDKKGVPMLLRVLGRLKLRRQDWKLDIVGDGPRRLEYEKMARDLNLCRDVCFHGSREKKEVASFMRRASLFVMPSHVETFSLVVAESLACGLPVLTTRCGGPEEYVTKEVGLTVPKNDERAFEEGLDYVLDHLDLFAKDVLSKYAKDLFCAEHVGAMIHEIYSHYL